MNEEKLNKIKKVIYWRAITFTVATIVSYLYLGEIRKSLELTIILTVLMTILHYFYEGFWENKTN